MLLLTLSLGLADAGCDAEGIRAVVEAVPQVGAKHQSMMAATGFAEACTTPRGVVEAARSLPSVPPDYRRMIDLKAATDAPTAWMGVCTGSTEGLRVLGCMPELPRDQQRDHLWTGCDLGELGWFTQEEWRAADGAIVVALAGAQAAADAGIDAGDVRVLARALAGIGGEAAPDPMDGLLDRFVEPMELELPEPAQPATGAGVGGGGTGAGIGWIPDEVLDLQPDRPGFESRVAPTWGSKARKEGGRCTVQVFVSREAELRKLTFLDCPKALQKDVTTAIEASRLRARVKDGTHAAGRFEATYVVD